MIGGQDITFRTDIPAQVTEGIVRILRSSWVDAVLENAETGEVLAAHALSMVELPAEILVYKNAHARASWNENGAVSDNANLMIHILQGTGSLTLVVDDAETGEMPVLLEAVKSHVYQDIFWMRANAA